MTDDPWLLLLSVPALVASVPFYVASVAYYWWCREGFADFLAFVDTFEGLPQRSDHHTGPTPGAA